MIYQLFALIPGVLLIILGIGIILKKRIVMSRGRDINNPNDWKDYVGLSLLGKDHSPELSWKNLKPGNVDWWKYDLYKRIIYRGNRAILYGIIAILLGIGLMLAGYYIGTTYENLKHEGFY